MRTFLALVASLCAVGCVDGSKKFPRSPRISVDLKEYPMKCDYYRCKSQIRADDKVMHYADCGHSVHLYHPNVDMIVCGTCAREKALYNAQFGNEGQDQFMVEGGPPDENAGPPSPVEQHQRSSNKRRPKPSRTSSYSSVSSQNSHSSDTAVKEMSGLSISPITSRKSRAKPPAVHPPSDHRTRSSSQRQNQRPLTEYPNPSQSFFNLNEQFGQPGREVPRPGRRMSISTPSQPMQILGSSSNRPPRDSQPAGGRSHGPEEPSSPPRRGDTNKGGYWFNHRP